MKIEINTLTPELFLELYSSVGWEPPCIEQVREALINTIATFTVYDCEQAVGMVRLIGDGGMSFYIKDFAVIPSYQSKGVDIEGRARIACKLSPDRNEELRDRYEGIMPAFHWNKKHWSDICYESFETAFVCDIIRESYRVLLRTLPKAVKLRWEEQLSFAIKIFKRIIAEKL